MDKLRIVLRDWWRGFTNEDLAAALRKTEKIGQAGQIVWLTPAEMKAWLAFARRHHPVPIR